MTFQEMIENLRKNFEENVAIQKLHAEQRNATKSDGSSTAENPMLFRSILFDMLKANAESMTDETDKEEADKL